MKSTEKNTSRKKVQVGKKYKLEKILKRKNIIIK